MVYQIDQHSYMVALTNGPLADTRLRFQGEPSQEEKDVMEAQVAEASFSGLGNQEGNLPEVSDQQAQELGQAQQLAAAVPETQPEVSVTVDYQMSPEELQALNVNSELSM